MRTEYKEIKVKALFITFLITVLIAVCFSSCEDDPIFVKPGCFDNQSEQVPPTKEDLLGKWDMPFYLRSGVGEKRVSENPDDVWDFLEDGSIFRLYRGSIVPGYTWEIYDGKVWVRDPNDTRDTITGMGLTYKIWRYSPDCFCLVSEASRRSDMCFTR